MTSLKARIGGIEWQTNRNPVSFADSIKVLLEIDPILVILGTMGIALSLIERDFFLIWWVVPPILFFILIGYSQYTHLVPLLPIFCISGARLIESLTGGRRRVMVSDRTEGETPRGQKTITDYFYKNKSLRTSNLTLSSGDILHGCIKRLSFNRTIVVVVTITIVGFASTLLLITTDINSSFFEVYASILQYLPVNDKQTGSGEPVTLIGPRTWGIHYFWIPKYIFDRDLLFQEEKYAHKVQTDEFLIIADTSDDISDYKNEKLVAIFKGNDKNYPGYKYPYSDHEIQCRTGL